MVAFLCPPPFWKTASGPTSFTLVGSSSGIDATIEISAIAALQANDLCLIFNAGDGGATTPDTTPAGFTQLCTVQNGRRTTISAKKLDGTETTVTGIDATTERWICLVLRPEAPWTSFTNHNTGNASDAADLAAQNINALSAGASKPVVMYGQMYASGAVTGRSATGMTEIANSGSTQQYAHYRLFSASDALVDQSYDMADSGTNFMQSGYLTFI